MKLTVIIITIIFSISFIGCEQSDDSPTQPRIEPNRWSPPLRPDNLTVQAIYDSIGRPVDMEVSWIDRSDNEDRFSLTEITPVLGGHESESYNYSIPENMTRVRLREFSPPSPEYPFTYFVGYTYEYRISANNRGGNSPAIFASIDL